jgi:prepilin-type N-terminal cleavage/methylation domain-containing protein
MRTKTEAAFTLLELVVVIGILSIVAAAVLPSLSHGESHSPAFECLNHHRQLCNAWRMYAEDNSDRLVPNLHGGAAQGGAGDPTFGMAWVEGWLDWTTRTDNTNIAFLIDPKKARLAPYVKGDTNLFKCPEDRFRSTVQANLRWQRVRSVSVDILLGEGNAESGPFDPSTYKHVRKLSEILYPVPAEAHVFLDEHPDSINDPGFWPPNQTTWVDTPAVYHHGGAAFGFADSHAEIHRWRGSLAKIKGSNGSIDGSYLNNAVTAPVGDPDIHWMSYHTARLGTNSY